MQTDIPAAILAGGEGRRLGGTVKALIDIDGTALIDRVANRIARQSRSLAICVRSRADWTAARGADVVIDWLPQDGAAIGPISGVIAALEWANARGANSVVTVPVDCPFVPEDLVARLSAAITPGVDIAVAASGGRRHHLVALWTTSVAERIMRQTGDGARAVHAVQEHFAAARVEWTCQPHDPFFNINTEGDLTRARAIARQVSVS